MDSSWKTRVSERVADVVGMCFPDNPDLAAKFLAPEHRATWYKSLVYETFDINDNYEELEYLGDRILKAVFPAVMFAKHPELTNSQLSNLDMFFMSKARQGQMATDLLEITQYILAATHGQEQDTSNLAVDVFESFFGALWTVGDKVAFGLGYVACYNLLAILFEGEEIQEEINGSKKTQVVQRLQQCGFKPMSSRESSPTLGVYTVELSFDRQTISDASKYLRVTLSPAAIRAGPASKHQATDKAYALALAEMDRAGLTAEVASERARQRQVSGIDRHLVEAAEAAARGQGYPYLSFLAPKKSATETYYVLLLIGENADKKRRILASSHVAKSAGLTETAPQQLSEARAQLLERFVRESSSSSSSSSSAPRSYRSRRT